MERLKGKTPEEIRAWKRELLDPASFHREVIASAVTLSLESGENLSEERVIKLAAESLLSRFCDAEVKRLVSNYQTYVSQGEKVELVDIMIECHRLVLTTCISVLETRENSSLARQKGSYDFLG